MNDSWSWKLQWATRARSRWLVSTALASTTRLFLHQCLQGILIRHFGLILVLASSSKPCAFVGIYVETERKNKRLIMASKRKRSIIFLSRKAQCQISSYAHRIVWDERAQGVRILASRSVTPYSSYFSRNNQHCTGQLTYSYDCDRSTGWVVGIRIKIQMTLI